LSTASLSLRNLVVKQINDLAALAQVWSMAAHADLPALFLARTI